MNAKTTIILLVCLLAAVGGLYFLQGSADDANQNKTESRKLIDLTFNDVKAYEIKLDSEPARAFTRVNDNDWKMTAPIATAAQGSQVESDVRKILDLTYDKAYGPKDDPPGNDLTSLDNPLAVVKLTDNDDNTHLLKIGARQQLSDKTYIKKVDSDPVYLVEGDVLQQFDKKLPEYRDKRLMNFRAADIVRLEVSGEINYLAVKEDAGWNIEAPFRARADLPTLNRAASALANLFVVDFIEDNPATLRPYGLNPPRLTVKATVKETAKANDDDDDASPPTTSERTITLALGAKVENNVFAHLVNNNPEDLVTVFQVSESTFKNLAPSANDLRDKRVVQFNQPLVSRIEYTTPDDSIVLQRNGSDWAIGEDTTVPVFAERSAVDDFLRVLKNIKAEGFEDGVLPKHGLDAPRATINVNLGSQGTTTVLLGAETPSKTGVYMQNASDDTVAVVPVAEANKILVDPISFNSRNVLRFDLAAVASFDLRRGNTQLTLTKQDDAWQMTAPITGDGNTENIEAMLKAYAGLTAMRVVGRSNDIGSFGLDAPQYSMVINLADASGSDASTIAFTAVRQGGSRYLLEDDGEFIYELDERTLSELDKEFLSTAIFGFAEDDVASISFSGDADITFERTADAEAVWQLKDEPTFEVAAPKLGATIGALVALNCERFVSYDDAQLEALGLDAPWRRVTVKLTNGESRTLEIADRGPNAADRYARIAEERTRAFVLLGTTVSQFNKSAADFKK